MLWAFAFAQPLFDVLADSPDFFVARGNTSGDIVVLALAVTLVPPTALVLLEGLLFALPRARRTLHLTFVALLLAAIVLQVIGDWDAPTALLIAVATALAALGTAAYGRTRVAPAVLSVLSPAPLVFLVVFLFVSPVTKLVLPEDEASASGQASGSTPVIVVVFDEFAGGSLVGRDGEVDGDRFPNFAALARDATWYRNATTVADGTTFAVPAILSGSRPDNDRLPIASDYPTNLFTALGSDRTINVEEPATDLCPTRLCGGDTGPSTAGRLRALFDDLTVVSGHLVLPSALDERLPAVDRAFAGFTDGGRDPGGSRQSPGVSGPSSALVDRVGQFDRFVDRLGRRQGKTSLNFLHTELPHLPWQYLPSGQSYPVSGSDPPGLTGDTWTGEAWPPRLSYQRYLLQAGFVDRLLGRLVRRLRERGLYDRSLIVVTADHGVSFRAGESRRLVTAANVADIASVPLFVKQPEQDEARVDDKPARTIDVLPTIARTLGITLAGEVDGRPLQGSRPAAEQVAVSSYAGGTTRVPFDAFVRSRDAETRRRLALLGDGGAPPGDLRPELIGRPTAGLASDAAAPFRVEFDSAQVYSSVAPDSDEVPVYVTGRLTGSARSGQPVAVAVNGQIAAVTLGYKAGGDLRIGAMVPGTAFRRGANDVEALAVAGSGGATRLARAGGTGGQNAALVRRNGRLVVASPGERPIPVRPGAADGEIETVVSTDTGLIVGGWASDPAHRRAADEVLLFADGRLVQAARPSTAKPELAKRLGAGLARAGYAFGATGAAAEVVPDPERLRVIAVVDGRASALGPATPGTFPSGQ